MITVAKDGSGHFMTVTEALESIPEFNTEEAVIFIKNGIYKEQIQVQKPYITLIGEDWKKTVLTYDLYGRKPAEDVGKLGTFRSYSALIDTHDFKAFNLTFENSAGLGREVGQAIALYVDGDRVSFNHCRMLASQDTLFTGPLPPKEIEKNGFIGPKQFAPRVNGRHYYKECFIRGDIDFIFGSATAYFESCELFSQDIGERINGYVTAASTPEGRQYGYVFSNCRFTGNCPPGTVYLGRPWRSYAKTVILNSFLDVHICEEGWHNWNKKEAEDTVYYAEYGNFGPGAALYKRPKWVKQLKEMEVGNYSREVVLGGNDGWMKNK